MVNCKYCSHPTFNKTFCSHPCRNAWTSYNNKTNNPIWDKKAFEKMRLGLLGRKQPDEEKLKRSKSLKRYYATHPEAKTRLVKNVWEKYTSKIAGTGWRKVRAEALKRDNYTCLQCGETNRKLLLVHHKDWNGKIRGMSQTKMNNNLSNLKTLCHKCHNGIHRHKSKDYQERKKEIKWNKE